MMDAVATTLDNAWGPRRLKGWCEAFALRLCAPGARCPRASRRRRRLCTSPAPSHTRQICLTRAPPPRYCLALMGCKQARCATRFCRYLKDADEAKHEATLKRRVAEAEAVTARGAQGKPRAGLARIGHPRPAPAHRKRDARQTRQAGRPSHADRDPTPLQGGWQRDNTG